MVQIDRFLADDAVLAEIGARLMRARLQANVTQEALAREAGISKRTLERVEHGDSTQFTALVRVLRALDLLGVLERLPPHDRPSSIEMLDFLDGRRRRASPTRGSQKGDWSGWGGPIN